MGIIRSFWTSFHISVFIDSCRFGDEKQAFSMLDQEPELAYARDKKGISALFHVAANGNLRIAQRLLQITKQANDVEREKGSTPLLIAATMGYTELVQLLLDYGADPNMRNYDGITALHNAVFEENVHIIKTLLNRGADATIQDRLGNSPRDIARNSGHAEIRTLFI